MTYLEKHRIIDSNFGKPPALVRIREQQALSALLENSPATTGHCLIIVFASIAQKMFALGPKRRKKDSIERLVKS